MMLRRTHFLFAGLIVLIQVCLTALGWSEQNTPLAAMDVRQKLNELLPLETVFKDESGKSAALKEYFKKQPVLLTFVYFSCPTICPLNIKSLAQSLNAIKESPGDDYELLVVSIDPRDTSEKAEERRKLFVSSLDKTVKLSGIHFLTGEQASIEKATQAAGFQYVKLEETGQYAHSAVLIALTPQGRISRYMFGLSYPPRDIQLALTESRQERIGTLAEKILMYCFKYDPHSGRYNLAVMNLVKLGAVLTVLLMGGLIYLMRKQEPIL